MTTPTVTMRHIRAQRLCSRGARAFFLRHGLDWSEFLRNGIAADKMEATGDAMAVGLARKAREEQQEREI